MQNKRQEKVTDIDTLSTALDTELKTGLKEALLTLGLSKYESQVLVSLYILKESEVKTIAAAAQVPMGRIYDALNNLTQNGLIQKIKVKGKPLRYRAYDYKVTLRNIYDTVKKDIDTAINHVMESVTQLQKIKVISKPSHEPIEVVFGDWNLSMTLKDTILRTENEIILSLSVEYLKNHQSTLEAIVSKNINVMAICISEEEKGELRNLGIPYYSLDLDAHMPALKRFFLEQNSRINGVMIDNRIVFLILLQAENEPYGILISHPSLVQTFSILIQSLISQLDE
ncbi:MAG: TrmB family transcriptional regulator [Promethearchaeota archaeon]